MEGDLLNGAGQYSLLILALACVTYIRTVPYQKLVAKLEAGIEDDSKRRWAASQAIVLDIMQLAFVAIGVLILGRELFWGATYDWLILRMYFGLVCVFMAFHLVVNLRGVGKALSKFDTFGYSAGTSRAVGTQAVDTPKRQWTLVMYCEG